MQSQRKQIEPSPFLDATPTTAQDQSKHTAIKRMTVIAYVRPTLEYASTVWDPTSVARSKQYF